MTHSASSTWPWSRPSERVLALMRRGAELALQAPEQWLEDLDGATFDRERMKHLAADPVLAAAIRRTTRANVMHWAAANVRDPGAPVVPNLGPEPLAVARDLVRRGLRESALDGYRVGQNVAWLRWMEIAFQLTQDPKELRELLELSGRSIAWFIDATIAGIAAHMAEERDVLTRGTHAERREVVALLLEGAPISVPSASQRLGYPLDQTHRAAVIWSDETQSELSVLEAAAEGLARLLGVQHPLITVASVATLWMWAPGKTELDPRRLQALLHNQPGVRVAFGSQARGVEGFRRSHLEALTAQRMLARLQSSERIVSFDEVRLVSLVTQDAEGAKAFVQQTLGELASAEPELQSALWTFLRAGCNVSRAAELLRTHRNTLLRRLTRAESLLPRALDEQRVNVAVALEVLRWQRVSRDEPAQPLRES